MPQAVLLEASTTVPAADPGGPGACSSLRGSPLVAEMLTGLVPTVRLWDGHLPCSRAWALPLCTEACLGGPRARMRRGEHGRSWRARKCRGNALPPSVSSVCAERLRWVCPSVTATRPRETWSCCKLRLSFGASLWTRTHDRRPRDAAEAWGSQSWGTGVNAGF